MLTSVEWQQIFDVLSKATFYNEIIRALKWRFFLRNVHHGNYVGFLRAAFCTSNAMPLMSEFFLENGDVFFCYGFLDSLYKLEEVAILIC